MFVVIFSLFLVAGIYWKFIHHFKYWEKRGIPHPPVSYFAGNFGEALKFKKLAGQIYTQIYNDYPKTLYVGFFKFRQPGIILRDPELIKKVLLKNFSTFHDNDSMITKDVDPLAGRNPFLLKGNDWKTSKTQISPCFTIKKLKEMFPLIEEVVSKLINFIDKELVSIGQNGIEAQELFSKYSTEVVASCAFGLDGKSFDKSNSKFREMNQKIFKPSFKCIIKNLIIIVFPPMANFLKVPFIPPDVTEYFINITKSTLEYRKKNGIVRNDFLDNMKELKSKTPNFTDIDIAAHAFEFVLNGYVASMSALSHAIFEIAANADVQEKLLFEILNTFKQNKGKIDYDILNDMTYLDLVFNETMRMHHPGLELNRMVTEPTTLPNPTGSGSDIPIEVGTPIIVPFHAIHNDPQYYPKPEIFHPERFKDNIKEYRNRCLFLPFGEGPRVCHGQKFGSMKVKLAIVHIVKNYEITVNRKTIVPLVIDPTHLEVHAKGGIWLNFEKRQPQQELVE